VCNHKPEHLENLISRTEVIPAVNQVEVHPNFTQPDLREAHARHGITTQCWSPLDGVYVYGAADPNGANNPLQDPTIVDLASKYL
jgi:diketogulonate reductase-like aldo/keto reductase